MEAAKKKLKKKIKKAPAKPEVETELTMEVEEEKEELVEEPTEAPSTKEEEEEEPEASEIQVPTEEKEVVEPEEVVEQKPKFSKNSIAIGLIVVLILAVIAGGVYVYKRGMKKGAAPATTPMPTESPEASPAVELKREDLKIQVLNGSGVAGVADEAKDFLKGLGYQEIEVGNADSYDYEETEVAIKEDKKDYLKFLTKDLSEEYTLSSETKTLDEDSDFDVVITLGEK